MLTAPETDLRLPQTSPPLPARFPWQQTEFLLSHGHHYQKHLTLNRNHLNPPFIAANYLFGVAKKVTLGINNLFTERSGIDRNRYCLSGHNYYVRGAVLYVQGVSLKRAAPSLCGLLTPGHQSSGDLFVSITKGEIMPHPVDLKLGKKLREIRTSRGMSQAELGKQLGITFQQIQKYETGKNRISVSRLFDIAGVFDLPIQWFLSGLDEKTKKPEISPKLESVNWDYWLTFLSRFDKSSADFIRSLLKFTGESEGKRAEAKEVLANYDVMQQNLFPIMALSKSLRNQVRDRY